MHKPGLIREASEATPEWFTQVLRAKGHDCRIDSFDRERIGTGQVGENVRFTLRGEGDHPATLVGKFMSQDPVSRATGVGGMTYSREVHFYQVLHPKTHVQTPRVLFTDIDEATQEFVILMEDMAPATQGDQIAGGDLAQARLAMTQAAKLHGPCWGAEGLAHGEIVPEPNPTELATNYGALWLGLQDGFLERYADRLGEGERRLVRELGANCPAYFGWDGTRTLIHGDYRLDNMLFQGAYPLAVVDWQTVAIGCGLQDVAYYLGTSLDPGLRREHEAALVQGYFDNLREDYQVPLTFDDCWRLYRRYAPAGLVMAVIASMIVGETKRGNDMFMAMAKRSVTMCEDLDSFALL